MCVYYVGYFKIQAAKIQAWVSEWASEWFNAMSATEAIFMAKMQALLNRAT